MYERQRISDGTGKCFAVLHRKKVVEGEGIVIWGRNVERFCTATLYRRNQGFEEGL